MSDVGMSHVRCPMYLSNDPKTKCDIWLSGHVTNTSDIVHGTSQHLTLHKQQLNAPLSWNRVAARQENGAKLIGKRRRGGQSRMTTRPRLSNDLTARPPLLS